MWCRIFNHCISRVVIDGVLLYFQFKIFTFIMRVDTLKNNSVRRNCALRSTHGVSYPLRLKSSSQWIWSLWFHGVLRHRVWKTATFRSNLLPLHSKVACLKMEAAGSSETLVHIYESVRSHVPEDSETTYFICCFCLQWLQWLWRCWSWP